MEKVRGRLVNFRVTDDEFEQLKIACDRQGARCLSAFARKMMLNATNANGENFADVQAKIIAQPNERLLSSEVDVGQHDVIPQPSDEDE